MADEKNLIKKSKANDLQAFEEVVGLHENMVFNLAYRLLGNKEDAEDVLQETFLNAFKALSGFRFEAKFSTWLYRIAYNLSLAKLKKRNVGQLYLDTQNGMFDKILANDQYHSSLSPEDALASKEASFIMEKAIQAIPRCNRAVFILRDIEGYTTREVADITSLSLSAVKSRLHRARMLLRKILTKTHKPRESYAVSQVAVAG